MRVGIERNRVLEKDQALDVDEARKGGGELLSPSEACSLSVEAKDAAEVY